ncbi:hypothetical protein PPOP_0133 [Paenibacillus popilliae ATCC 14706]|uniref:Uncharacterized protein n=1 Tax=Paenibacillus popilliae ATCC 14706 TaxID=1212764 RepID=M9LL23_PAEPP|nr:hypothetical protein PPOP_0133 [Paenibacillus popilliae ATCC 14706]
MVLSTGGSNKIAYFSLSGNSFSSGDTQKVMTIRKLSIRKDVKRERMNFELNQQANETPNQDIDK